MLKLHVMIVPKDWDAHNEPVCPDAQLFGRAQNMKVAVRLAKIASKYHAREDVEIWESVDGTERY